MTEKSEDQVVFICQTNFSHVWGEMPFIQKCCECSGELIPYIPHSKYLALKKNLEGAEYIIDVEHRRNNKLESDLAVAVEALRRIAEPSSEDIVIPIRKIAKEALGKIGNK